MSKSSKEKIEKWFRIRIIIEDNQSKDYDLYEKIQDFVILIYKKFKFIENLICINHMIEMKCLCYDDYKVMDRIYHLAIKFGFNDVNIEAHDLYL